MKVGDEMNIHLAQTIQARNELEMIANVKYQIIAAKDSNPIIGCVQDSLSGAYMLSMDENIPYEIASNLLCNTSSTTKHEMLKNVALTGHQVFSHIIPNGINSTVKKGGNIIFQIKNGELTEGLLDKSQLSTKKNSIIHYIWDKYGPNHTQHFIDDTQRLVLNYLLDKGLTVGLKDTFIPDTLTKEIKEIIHTKIISTNHRLTQFENDNDKIIPESGEGIMNMDLNTVSSNVGKIIMDVLDKNNGFNILVSSGAKGSALNITQIAGCLGQVAIEGQRIKKRVAGRTLPIFHQNDDTPEARGFVPSCFLDGLKGHEFFFHTMGGREGLIDTAIKSVTGDTPVIIMEDNNIKRLNIGDWIDNYLDIYIENVEHYQERDMELLKLSTDVYIPTVDADGNVTWGKITAITRHDPGNMLYEIKTKGGRKVIVTESKSLLVWNNMIRKFIHMSTPDVKVGDCVPVTMNLNNIFSQEDDSVKLRINNGVINCTSIEDRDNCIMRLNNNNIYCDIDGLNLYINNNCNTINDVVLDPIVEINHIDVTLYPKVYDLTVPSTLNFGLANGLHVVDTAETGYIQRKCIKFMEDLMVNYEGIIRTANGILVQYLYGESGIDQQKQTQVKINLINMNNETIKKTFIFTDEEKKYLEKHYETNIDTFNKKTYDTMINMRDKLRKIYTCSTGNYKIIEDNFMLPINLLRITQELNGKSEMAIDPQYIMDAIDNMLYDYDERFITVMKKNSKLLREDDKAYKFILRLALYEYISPKSCIVNYKLNKNQFDKLIEDIRVHIARSLVEPGEMVGVVAAQSIGEPTSQMSIISSTKIRIVTKSKKTNLVDIKTVEFGKLCDSIINNNSNHTYNTGHINSVETELNMLDDEYYIVGVDGKEKTHWNKISHISRHPVNGDLVKVVTKSGRIVTTTLSHSHLIRKNHTIVPITGSELKLGMRIPVARRIDNTFMNTCVNISNKKHDLTYLFGWFVGAYLAKGYILNDIIHIAHRLTDNMNDFIIQFNEINPVQACHEKYESYTMTQICGKELIEFFIDNIGTDSVTKKVPDFAFTASNEFKTGLIQAYFDEGGNFNSNQICAYSNETIVTDIAMLLSYFDIFGLIKKNTSNHSKDLNGATYKLLILSHYHELYKEHIGTLLHKDKLNNMFEYELHTDIYNIYDHIDRINGLGKLITNCDMKLDLSEQNRICKQRTYAISRRVLEKYINVLENHSKAITITNEIELLKQARDSDVIWDEIISIDKYTPDQGEYVYDFTVPGNQTFMINNGILVHNTLNTKHFAGVAGKGSANSGVPRIKEIMSYSKNIKTPQTIVYFNDIYNTNKSDTNMIASYFKHLTIKELIESAEIYYSMDGKDELSNILAQDNTTNPFYVNNAKDSIKSLPFVIRLKMNLEKMMDKETTLLDIKTKFITYWYKNFSNLKTVKKHHKEILLNVDRLAILGNNDNIIHIRFRLNDFNYTMLTSFLDMILNVITLKGIDNIANVTQNQERRMIANSEGDMIVEKEYVAVTDGINLDGILMLKGINHNRTRINDIETVYKRYGVEAARNIIINELINTYEAGGGGSINHAHISLLVDTMTYSGEVVSIDRHGMNKVDNDPISKASFENTMDHFINAAIFSETDKLKSVSSRLAVGRVMNGGTGSFDLILDTEKLRNSEYIENETGGRTSFIPLTKEPLFGDIIEYGFARNDFFIPN